MKLQLLNTPLGLKPCYPEDYDEAKKLKVGVVYEAEIKVPRNYQFHKLFFALLNTAYAYIPGDVQSHYFPSVDAFRKSVLIAAGFVNRFWSVKHQCFLEEAESISFSSMDDARFREVYNGCKDVIFGIIGRYVTEEEFERNLINF